MKRKIQLLLIVITLLCLQACTQKTETEDTPAPTQSITLTPAPSPSPVIPEDPNETVLAAVEALFSATNEKEPYLQYWAESGSGPSTWYGIDKDIYLPRMKEFFLAQDWKRVEEQPKELYVEPPEGAAYSLVFHSKNKNSAITMQYGESYITVHGELYQTEDCPTLYRALEELWYEVMEPQIENAMLKALDEFDANGTITVRMIEGAAKEKAVDWDKACPQIKALFEAQTWISIPGGPVDPTVRKGQAVVLSNGEDDMSFWAAGPYLSYRGYSYKTVDVDGNDSPIYDTLCGLLGLTQKEAAAPPAPAVESAAPQGEESKEVLARIDAIIKAAGGDLGLEYFGDGASGPSLSHRSWEKSDLDKLSAVFSAYDWKKIEEPLDNQVWTEEMQPPEGGAYYIRLRGAGGLCEMSYNYSKHLYFRGTDGSADYYATTDYDSFYEAMERFCYELEWQHVQTYLWSNLDEHFSGKTLTLCQSDGATREIAWGDISGEVKKLVESRIWIFLPEGSQVLDSEGERLSLSTGEEHMDLIAYAQNGYLQTPGYLYKAVDKSGAVDSLYSELCTLLENQ